MNKKNFLPTIFFTSTALLSIVSCADERLIFDGFWTEAMIVSDSHGFKQPLKRGANFQVGDIISVQPDNSIIKLGSAEECFKGLTSKIVPESISYSFNKDVGVEGQSKIESQLKAFENNLANFNMYLDFSNNNNYKVKINGFSAQSTSLLQLSKHISSLQDPLDLKACLSFLNKKNTKTSIILGLIYVDSLGVETTNRSEVKTLNSIEVSKIPDTPINSGKLSAVSTPFKYEIKYEFKALKALLAGQLMSTDNSHMSEMVKLIENRLSSSPTPAPTPTTIPSPNLPQNPQLTTQGIFGCWKKQNSSISQELCFGETSILNRYPNLSEPQKDAIKAYAPHVYVELKNNEIAGFKQYEVLNQKLFLYGSSNTCASADLINGNLQLPEFVDILTNNCNEESPKSDWERL